nr:hypothetical protein [Kibdelosporangium sp. MJ126-NF4]CEL19502.1 hypothetical protein [Kibdelosporangium sp. MJ126-NF4]CTQ94699.1 hypothetical protein [Kibdelosporangium sp. MJ126-NF4]
MKWTRAYQHVEALAEACDKARTLPFPVIRLWVFGPFVESRADLDTVDVALEVDLPEIPWLSTPSGASHWANATRLSRNPFTPVWRSAGIPVWNHTVVRPVQVWSGDHGVTATALAAIRDGEAGTVQQAAPSPEESAAQLDVELAISLAALRSHTAIYEEKRWAPGKLEPVADALWSVTRGYLDLLDAL